MSHRCQAWNATATSEKGGKTDGTRKFSDLVTHIENDPARRSRVDALEQAAWDELAAHNLRELRRAREMTQAELARRLERAQPAVAAMEKTEDHLVSTVRAVVESLGGRLELTAVFDDQRIPIVAPPRTRTRNKDQRVATAAAADLRKDSRNRLSAL